MEKNNNSTQVELTEGFQLLGNPVGSAKFAAEFLTKQIIESVNLTHDLLTKNLQNNHTKIKLFTQSIINKLPHLLDANVMHNYPIHEEAGKFWHNWKGQLIHGIIKITNKFFRALLHIDKEDSFPQYATLIANLNCNKGGLGILNTSLH